MRIDLNCDMGESFGAYTIGNDEELLNYIVSANIACGFHGGDPSVIRKTVDLAVEKGVAVGAHPGFPDLPGFGRRNMNISAKEVYEIVLYQVGAMAAFVKAAGDKLQHVKPHGALYNMAAKDKELADAIAEAVYRFDPELFLFGLSGSYLITSARAAGLKTVNEAFADRTYQQDGSLTPRSSPDALITRVSSAAGQVLKMIKEKKVITQQGKEIEIQADTICIHGDSPHALEFAREIKQSLISAGIAVKPVGRETI